MGLGPTGQTFRSTETQGGNLFRDIAGAAQIGIGAFGLGQQQTGQTQIVTDENDHLAKLAADAFLRRD